MHILLEAYFYLHVFGEFLIFFQQTNDIIIGVEELKKMFKLYCINNCEAKI